MKSSLCKVLESVREKKLGGGIVSLLICDPDQAVSAIGSEEGRPIRADVPW
jgi:hypothetical protein